VRILIIIFFAINTVHAQSNLNKDLSRLFGNLPMDLPANEIISIAGSSKNFKGHVHQHLELAYSGIMLKTNFFNLKPDTCFIEIMHSSEEFPPDSLMAGFYFFVFDAGYSKASSMEIKKEFDRIVKLFSAYFSSGIIKKEEGRENFFKFFKSETEVNPTLILWIGEGEYGERGCYSGKQCIKITYEMIKSD
jgi:hypothetical protein